MEYSASFKLLLLLAALTPDTHCKRLRQADNEIMKFNSEPEPTIDPKKICSEYSALSDHQSDICAKYPHATASAIQGVMLAIHECQRQFLGYRWNCSNLDTSVIQSHPMLETGYKEVSFIYAVTAAGVVHQVAQACALGKIPSCACNGSPYADGFDWKGCSHDLGFGAKYARKFLQNRNDDMQALMQAHNTKLGRKAVIDQKSTKCKCHGMSSSCEIKTCWLSTPDFAIVGNRLKSLYDNSIQVTRGNSIQVQMNRSPTKYDITIQNYEKGGSLNRKMVYYERSPTYCNRMDSVSVPGTSGRRCNSSSEAMDSCSTLCCGRGYFTVKVRRTEKCKCEFHWCCYVICQKCEYDEWVTICK